jgi:gas vesicle protein
MDHSGVYDIMRIPPFYQRPNWQRFLGGIFLGAVIGWLFFLYIYGESYNKQVLELKKKQAEIDDLKKDIEEIWKKDYEECNKQNQRLLKVQEIKIKLNHHDKMSLLTVEKLQQEAKNYLRDLIKKDIETVAKNKEFIMKTIQDKSFVVDDQKYQLRVQHFFLFTTLELHLTVKQIQ